MTAQKEQEPPIKVMAILVLYRRAHDKAASWPALNDMMCQPGSFMLSHCLVHDNSPHDNTYIAPQLPKGFELRLNPENTGTAGAYAGAVSVAKAQNCDWLLLLDQDTELPQEYLRYAAESSSGLRLPVDAIVPRVWHQNQLISPSILTSIGSIRPTADLSTSAGIPTAISSGALVRTEAIEAVMPFPQELWLDYLDHWMFFKFAGLGFKVRSAQVDLNHNLSIKNLDELEQLRLENILRAEAFFFQSLGNRARFASHIRLSLRSLRFLAKGEKKLAATVIKQLLRGLKRK